MMFDMLANLSHVQMLVFGICAIVALLVLYFMLRKLSKGRSHMREGDRLGISEFYEIDETRRLVLIKRDGVEHLVMIGGAQDLVIETGIVREATNRATKSTSGVQMRQPTAPVFGVKRPTSAPAGEAE